MDEYIDEFMEKAAQVTELSNPMYKRYFLNGLKMKIHTHIHSHEATNISKVMKKEMGHSYS